MRFSFAIRADQDPGAIRAVSLCALQNVLKQIQRRFGRYVILKLIAVT